MTLNFNHPVKELIWVNARGSTGSKAGCEFFPIGHTPASDTTFVPDGDEDDLQMKLQLNGHDRMAYRDAKYYKTTQLYQHHSHCPTSEEKELAISIQAVKTAADAHTVIFQNNKHIRVTDVWHTGEGDSATTAQVLQRGGAVMTAGLTASHVELTAAMNWDSANAAHATFANIDSNRWRNVVPAHYGLSLKEATVADKHQNLQITYEELPTLIAGDCDNMADIYCYSFALKPEEHQPSGTCNFSRIDNAKLMSDTDMGNANSTIKVFAVNYNVLRIMSGMGGLAYSN